MRGSYRHDSDSDEAGRVRRYANEMEHRDNNNRADPQGFRGNPRAPVKSDTPLISSEQRLQRVLHRTSGPIQAEPPRQQTVRQPLETRQPREKRDNIWNAFTGTYHVGDSSVRNDKSRHQEVTNSAERRVPERPLASNNQDEVAHFEGEYVVPRTPRRVKFAEKLEIDTKTIYPEAPKTPTLPILRSQRRGLPMHMQTPTDTKENIGGNIQVNIGGPRDPTPKSSEKKKKDLTKKPEPAGVTDHLAFKDPPLAPASLTFSPAAKRRPAQAERRERPKKVLEISDARSQNSRGVVEPTMTPPKLPLYSHSPKTDRWNVADIFPQMNEPMTPRRADDPVYSKEQETMRALDELRTRQPMFRSNTQPLRAFSPHSDHWEPPNYFPAPQKEEPSVADQLPDSWGVKCPSPNDSGNDSPTAYLINKYANSSKLAILERARAKSSRSIAIPTGDNPSGLTPTGLPATPNSMASPATLDAVPAGFRGKKASKQKGYSTLDNDDEDEDPFSQGTELILLPHMPLHIGTSSAYKAVQSPKGSTTPKRRGTGFLKRQRKELFSPQKSTRGLPIIALSYGELTHVKQSTSTSDESDSETFYNAQASGWDRFDEDSAKDIRDQGPLIPSTSFSTNRSYRRMILAVIFMSMIGLGMGIYHFLSVSTDHEAPAAAAERSACVVGNTSNFLFSERYVQLRNQLVVTSEGDSFLIDVAGSPQRKAVCWVADFDERQLPINRNNTSSLLQRYTMGVLYYSLVREGDSDNTSLKDTDFMSSEHECDWEVVMCSVAETVTAILMADKQLEGILPDEVGNLGNLSFLELSMNQISGAIPKSIGKLTMLEYFGLAFNTLTGSMPSELGAMTKLEFINMRSSQLLGTIPSELGRLTALETLLVEGNWLSGTIPTELGRLHKAEQLSFHRNYLSGRVSAEICELRKGKLTELMVDSWVECICCTS